MNEVIRKEIWESYRSCWNNSNSKVRSASLQKITTFDFEYRDPNTEIQGSMGLSAYMEQFQNQFEGANFLTENIITHHNRSLIYWKMLDIDNQIIGIGGSFVLWEEEKLKEITGFFKTE